MSLPDSLRRRLTLPAFCAPMFFVSTPALVREACLAGVIGGLPRHNAASIEQFEDWLKQIRGALDRAAGESEGRVIGPLAVNMASNLPGTEMPDNLALCAKYGVDIIVNATGNPTELTQRAHDAGMLVYADAIHLRFAHKAMAAGVDGITAIGSGGGGHSGTLNHFVLAARIREDFDGTLVLAGGISTGAGIRAAEVLGADLAYLGTRFIATEESGASDAYKAMLVSQSSADLLYTPKIAGIAANWLTASMRRVGLDPDDLPEPLPGKPGYGHLPATAKPWETLWSAGQGIDQIHDVPSVRNLVERLRSEYLEACAVPGFAAGSRPRGTYAGRPGP